MELQNIIVSGMPFYDTVSLFCFDSFACFKFVNFFFSKDKLCYYELDFFNISVSKKFGKFNVTYRKLFDNPLTLFNAGVGLI